MPDVRTVAIGATTVGANYEKFAINTSDAGREQIVKVSANAGILHTELLAIYRSLTLAAGTPGYNAPDLDGPDAFTSAAVGTADGTAFVSGTTTVVFLRVQGTGSLSTVALKTAAEAVLPDTGTTFTITVEAVFQPAK
jgi:hypothetical protein